VDQLHEALEAGDYLEGEALAKKIRQQSDAIQ
jgi:hypothetical protein